MANPIVTKLMKQVGMEWALSEKVPFDKILFQVLSDARAGSSERKICTDTLYKLIRFLPLFDLLPLKPENPTWVRALIDAIQKCEKLGLQELIEKHECAKPTYDKDLGKHLEKIHGFPTHLLKNIPDKSWLNLHESLHCMLVEAPLAIRINTLKKESPELLESLEKMGAQPSSRIANCYVFSKRTNLLRNPFFLDGYFEIQDEHSQMASLCLGVEPHHKVLDLCAGGGGKTLHLSALMNGQGEIWATDINEKKIENLRTRARRADANNIRTFDVNTKPPMLFDRVLVDAPCSSLGTLRRNPDRLFKITEKEFQSTLLTQKQLLLRGMSLLKPGGRLVYSTCSILPKENQELVFSVLADNPKTEFVDIRHSLTNNSHFISSDSFLTEYLTNPVLKMAELSPSFSPYFLNLGPSQASGGLIGDGFFISLVELK